MIPSDVNGNKPFTHGQADIIDIMQTGVYPLMHVTPLSVQFDPRGKALLFTLEVVFAGKPYTEENKQEYVTEVLSDTAQLCHDLVSTIHNSTYELFDRAITIEGTTSASIFIDEFSQVLSGHSMTLTLRVPNGHSFCDVPVDFNLSAGAGGGGGNFGANYVKSIAVTGQSTVVSTQPADTFTFVAGTGMTIVTNALTKTITFTASGGTAPTLNTRSTWETSNPVLALGAIGIESDYLMWKIGDGVSTWNNLEYMRSGAVHESSAFLAVQNDVYSHGLLIVEDDTGRGKMGNGTTAYNSLPYLWVGGPSSAVNNNIAAFDGASGRLIKDTGIASTDILTTTAAASTYLTQANAALTYLTQANAATTYITISAAASTYLTQASAALTYQPLDSDLTTIAGLSPASDDFLQYKSGAWANRTVAQVQADLDVLTATAAALTYLTQSNAASTYVDFTDLFTSVLAGIVPASGGGLFKFLRADGTWTNILAINRITTQSEFIPGGSSFIVSRRFEIAAGTDLEVGLNAHFEIT